MNASGLNKYPLEAILSEKREEININNYWSKIDTIQDLNSLCGNPEGVFIICN